MAAQVTDYKCPACTGPLHFDGATGKMKCDYCDSVFTVEEMEESYAEANEIAAEAPERSADEWGDEAKNMAAYSCPSCGAELIYEKTVAVASCPYCGNNTVIPAQFKGALKPDKVLPFKLDKNAAKEALKAHMARHKLVPEEFRSSHSLEEIKSVYVPYWLYDTEVRGSGEWTGQTERLWEDADYTYKEVKTFHIRRSGSHAFERVPANGSSKMDDDLMESLEPFDYSALTDFKAAYLAGYPTDRYDIEASVARGRAIKRVKSTFDRRLRNTVEGYVHVDQKKATFSSADSATLYALLPVWLMHVTWEGNRYTFGVNGQTGHIVGNMPISKRAFWKWQGIYTAIFAAIVFVIALLIILL